MSAIEPRPPRHNRSFWLKHTEQWKQSGLTKIAYCTKHSLKPMSFYNWSKKLENDNAEPLVILRKQTTASFVPVQLDATTIQPFNQVVQVKRANTSFDFPVELNNDQLNQWLKAIHALSV